MPSTIRGPNFAFIVADDPGWADPRCHDGRAAAFGAVPPVIDRQAGEGPCCTRGCRRQRALRRGRWT